MWVESWWTRGVFCVAFLLCGKIENLEVSERQDKLFNRKFAN